MLVCPWSPSPSGEDLALCCSADVLCLRLLLPLIVLHCRVYAPVWECESLRDRDRQTRWHAGERDYHGLTLSPTHTLTHIISITDPSGELFANASLSLGASFKAAFFFFFFFCFCMRQTRSTLPLWETASVIFFSHRCDRGLARARL